VEISCCWQKQIDHLQLSGDVPHCRSHLKKVLGAKLVAADCPQIDPTCKSDAHKWIKKLLKILSGYLYFLWANTQNRNGLNLVLKLLLLD
jgi:hypothetical protein